MMASFHDLAVGERFRSEERVLTEQDLALQVRSGGYTHPLFTDPAYAAGAGFDRIPFPGEAVLLMMGGLAEQTGRFDDTTLALTGLDSVSFANAAFPGDAIALEIEVIDKARTPSGTKGLVTMRWRCVNAEGGVLCEATARMLFRL